MTSCHNLLYTNWISDGFCIELECLSLLLLSSEVVADVQITADGGGGSFEIYNHGQLLGQAAFQPLVNFPVQDHISTGDSYFIQVTFLIDTKSTLFSTPYDL